MKKNLFLNTFLLVSAASGIAIASEAGGHTASPLDASFLWGVFNFTLFVIILWKFALPAIRKFFAERSQNTRQFLKEAEEAKSAADARLKEYEGKLAALDKETEALRAQATEEGKAEKERLIQLAAKEAEAIKQQAKVIAEQEIKRAKQELKKEAARLSLQRAEELVKEAINDDDQIRLMKDYIKQIASRS